MQRREGQSVCVCVCVCVCVYTYMRACVDSVTSVDLHFIISLWTHCEEGRDRMGL